MAYNNQVQAQSFIPYDPVQVPAIRPENLVIPQSPLKYDILFQAGDTVWLNNKPVKSRGSLDFLAYVPIDSFGKHGYLWTNHETSTPDPLLGNGGAATVLEIQWNEQDKQWKKVAKPKAIDFSSVGGTWNNCLGAVTPWNTILTSEEYEPQSNAELHKLGWKDTTPYKEYPKYLNYGWVVEVDIKANPPTVQKRWHMGRFSHEGILCMPDQRTVYLMDDYAPGIFFKFYAAKAGSYAQGQLYALEVRDTVCNWIPLPMDRESVNNIRHHALKMGASIFIRLEDIALSPIGKIFVTETGRDKVDLQPAIQKGGKLAPHLEKYRASDGTFQDYYGRILVYDPINESLKVFLEGGKSPNGKVHMANPDNISVDLYRNQLIIHEDINDITQGRVEGTTRENLVSNEVYTLDLNIPNPSLNDLNCMVVAPLGSETTGGCFNSSFSTYFMNIQHPSPKNQPPFNRDATIGIHGFKFRDR